MEFQNQSEIIYHNFCSSTSEVNAFYKMFIHLSFKVLSTVLISRKGLFKGRRENNLDLGGSARTLNILECLSDIFGSKDAGGV